MNPTFLELLFVAIAIAIIIGAVSGVNQRNKRLAENSRLIEEALKNPAIDRATLETLTFQLTGRRPLRSEKKGAGLAWILALGWIALFTGIGLLIGAEYYAETYGSNDMGIAAWIVGLSGFGLVTYPFALRELESRRAA